MSLEASLAVATLKFTAQHKELNDAGFTLTEHPPNEAPEIEAAARRLINSMPGNAVVNQSIFFEREIAADKFATSALLECVAVPPLPSDDTTPGYVSAVRGLFAVSIASWYQDLLAFIEELVGPDVAPGAGALMLAMVQSREQYIRASSLFGEAHRFTLLRATLAIEQLLRPHLSSKASSASHSDAVHRHALLAILMDTAVKLAFIGHSTSWMLQKDAARGTPQIFMMQFFNLAEELRRLKLKIAG
jgi:hypothetical protein